MIRKFTLTNSNNVSWTFTSKSVKSFLMNPQGLGYSSKLDVIRYGEKANVSNEVYDFPSVSGELVFYDTSNANRYKLYNDFARFCTYTPLTLSYVIPLASPETYTLKCYVTSLTKTESIPSGVLNVGITMQGLGFWNGAEIATTGTASSYSLTNNGDFPVGLEITVTGSLENPYVTFTQDGDLYGEAKFDDSTAFDEVYVDSKDGEQNVILEQSGSTLPNPLSYQDLSISNGSIYVTFVKLARGTSTLAIGMDSGSITSVSIKYTPQYRSV